MPTEDQLLPVFVPPLADIFSAAERKKGAPLTKAEAEQLRNQAVCIMMKVDDARTMAQTRGFVDIHPENFWVDWHRLRPQMMGGFLPKIVLCIPGGNELRNACAPLLEAADLHYELQAYDQRIKGSFQTASMSWPSLSPEDFTRLDSHTTVLYVLSEDFTPASALETCTAMMSVGRQLLDAGEIGIKIDSSGIAHSAQRWGKFAEAIRRYPEVRSTVLFDAYVLRPIASDDELFTCGMHLLGAPDLIVAKSALQPAGSGAESSLVARAAELFRSFGVYLISECPVGHFAPGHTFSIYANAPRYRMLWEPCEVYTENNFFHNPFGLWRFTQV